MDIITHAGSAHFDEWAATGLLIAAGRRGLLPDGGRFERIIRRNPTPRELNDPNSWVVDVGLRLDFNKHCFDHHQDISIPPAFVLVMEFLGIADLAREHATWVKPKSMIDLIGPDATAERLRIPSKSLKGLNSPIERFVVRQFESVKEIDVEYSNISVLMGDWGEDLLSYLKGVKKRLIDLPQHIKMVEVDENVIVAFSDIEEFPSLGISSWWSKYGKGVAAIGIPDRRNTGWAIRNYGNKFDFRSIADEAGVIYVTNNGDIMKTAELTNPEDMVGLLRKARR